MKIGIRANYLDITLGLTPRLLIQESLSRKYELVLAEKLKHDSERAFNLKEASVSFSNSFDTCDRVFFYDFEDLLLTDRNLLRYVWCPDGYLSKKRIWDVDSGLSFVNSQVKEFGSKLTWTSGIIPGEHRCYFTEDSEYSFQVGVVIFDDHSINFEQISTMGETVLIVGSLSDEKRKELVKHVENTSQCIFFAPMGRIDFLKHQLKKCKEVVLVLSDEVPTALIRSAINQIYPFKKKFCFIGDANLKLFPQLIFADKAMDTLELRDSFKV